MVQGCGPDSSLLSTIIASGAAGYSVHMSTPIRDNPNIYVGAANGVNEAVRQRHYRDLAGGKTIGEAERNMENYRAGFGPTPYGSTIPLFVADNMLVGEPNMRLRPSGPGSATQMRILAAPGPGSTTNHPGSVRGFTKDGVPIIAFPAYGNPSYGANVVGGNIDLTAQDEIVTGAGYGPGLSAQVKAFNDDGSAILKVNFLAYGTLLGVNVAVVDVDNDGIGEIFTAPGPGSGAQFAPQVRGWDFDGVKLEAIPTIDFNAFPGGEYGANLAGGNVLRRFGTRKAGTHQQLVVTRGGGPTQGPEVRVYYFRNPFGVPGAGLSPILSPVQGFVLLPSSYGATVAVGDVDGGVDGYDDMLFGAGPGPAFGGKVVAYAGGRDDALAQSPFINHGDVFSDGGRYGARIGVTNLDGDFTQEVLAARGPEPSQSFPNGNSRILGLDFTGNPLPTRVLDFQAFSPDTGAGPLGGTGGGVSVSGMGLGNVPLLPAAPIDTPLEGIDPIEIIAGSCADSTVQNGQVSRDRLMLGAQDVRAALLVGDLGEARRRIGALRSLSEFEFVCPFLGPEFRTSLDALELSVQLQEDNVAPVAVIEGPVSPVCPGSHNFSAQASTDADERGHARSDIQTYAWTLDGNPATGTLSGGEEGPTAALDIPPGTHLVEVTVTDTFGASSTASMVVTAEDTEPPTARPQAFPSTLWPPDHQMVTVAVDLNAVDNCRTGSFRLVSVSSDEPETGCGSGSFAPDIAEAAIGTDDTVFQVRAERCGDGDGRVYTAVYEVFDASGNSAEVSVPVVVPHNQ